MCQCVFNNWKPQIYFLIGFACLHYHLPALYIHINMCEYVYMKYIIYIEEDKDTLWPWGTFSLFLTLNSLTLIGHPVLLQAVFVYRLQWHENMEHSLNLFICFDYFNIELIYELNPQFLMPSSLTLIRFIDFDEMSICLKIDLWTEKIVFKS